MLNISQNSISNFIEIDHLKSASLLRRSNRRNLPLILTGSLLFVFFLCLFLPWTQNISSKGYVTTLTPDQRPQAIQAIIAGRLEKWYIREGDFVQVGDTIAFISEIKSDYFDPDLITRTTEQLDAKSQSIQSYDQKVMALETQLSALREGLEFKKEQTLNKILQTENNLQNDSIDLNALQFNLEIAENQRERTQSLYDKGLKTLTELQEKEFKVQSIQAKVNVQINKITNRENELVNLNLELNALEREYADKMAKTRSDQQSALSSKLESMAQTSKIRNQLSNYSERRKLYYITAPQSGYITKTLKKGIGETIKEGADLATIMPEKYDLAVELYVRPIDLPLLDVDQEVRLRFDGWPAIVISGWPKQSTGVFTGKIFAVDRFIGQNGLYRVLVQPENSIKEWPERLRVGTGTNGFILLNNVPIWYELWRQLNGFPPDFYATEKGLNEELKRKAPLKSVK